jgi:hypothetical protein
VRFLLAVRADAVDPDPVEIPVPVVLGVALACVLAAVVLATAIGRHGGRRRELLRLAAAHGLVYSDGDPAGIAALRFPTFAGARGVVIRDVLTMRTPHGDVRAFDFTLWDEHERSRSSRESLGDVADHVFGLGSDSASPADTQRSYSRVRSGVVVRVDAFMPTCTIRPVSWATKTFEAIGVADLDFESDAFNNGWDVRCSDRRFASLFVDAQLIDVVLSLDERIAAKVSLETFGNYVLVTSDLCRPSRQVELLQAVARLPQLVSPLVIEEYPTALAMHARSSTVTWQQRPDGRNGLY